MALVVPDLAAVIAVAQRVATYCSPNMYFRSQVAVVAQSKKDAEQLASALQSQMPAALMTDPVGLPELLKDGPGYGVAMVVMAERLMLPTDIISRYETMLSYVAAAGVASGINVQPHELFVGIDGQPYFRP